MYNCRTSGTWADDLALSITYLPDRQQTWAVLYGCTESLARLITDRLAALQLRECHPLILPLIFAETERNRLFKLVDDRLSELVRKVLNTANNWAQSADGDLMFLWLEISYLKNGLETWRQQLEEMFLHTSAVQHGSHGEDSTNMCLQDPFLGSNDTAPVEKGSPLLYKLETDNMSFDEEHNMGQAGIRIRKRLKELRGEYDEKIRSCNIMIDGMILATQMVLFLFFL